MEKYTAQLIIGDLIQFVHNNLPIKKMGEVELFLQQNDLYADIADSLIDIVTTNNFSLKDTQAFLNAPQSISHSTVLQNIFFTVLEKKYNTLKLSVQAFKQTVEKWFQSAPPLEFGVALMSNNLKVLAPKNEAEVDSSVAFELDRPIENHDMLVVNIFESGNEKPVIELNLKHPAQQFSVDVETYKMHPGIYYWRVQLIENGEKAEGSFCVKPLFRLF